MLSEKELHVLRQNAKVHKKVFDTIREITKPWTTAIEIDTLAGKICRDAGVIPAFLWVYGYPNNIQTSVNNVVVHGIPRENIIFKEGDVVTFDFWVKDKKYWINTDAAFTMIVWDGPHDKKIINFLKVNKKALDLGVAEARHGNTVWDIWYAVQTYVESQGFHIVKELTGHGIGKKLHEEPYIYNFGTPGTWKKLKKWMLLAIEPILWFSSGKIVDQWDWEIYIADGSLGSQFEHTILITDGAPEIII